MAQVYHQLQRTALGRLGPAVLNTPEFNELDEQKQNRGGPSPRHCVRERVEPLSARCDRFAHIARPDMNCGPGSRKKKRLEEKSTMKSISWTIVKLWQAALFATSLFLFARATPVQAQDRSDCLKSPVMQEGGSGMAGKAWLCFSADGVRARMFVHNLVPGRAYTVWLVYFDDPSKCITAPGTANPCGPPGPH